MKPIRYGPFKIIDKVGNNAFRLDLPPYMQMYAVVNVENLKLYEPPLIDDQGELALIIEEKYDRDFLISGYALLTGSKTFRREELQATYTVAGSLVRGEDKKVRGTLSSYFGVLKDIRDICKQ